MWVKDTSESNAIASEYVNITNSSLTGRTTYTDRTANAPISG